ncbi:MAG: hypothetical protein KKF44_04445 [Nanoarchaeota archaeon]|nr:hypothetical protein [Nanoarchaeota archaeon]
MEFTKYELEALKETLEKVIPDLENQMKMINKVKHANSEHKKSIKRNIDKKVTLLKDVLKKLQQ